MKIADRKTPVVVLNCKLGGLGIMRSLGKKGIKLYGVDADRTSPGLLSRYCKERFYMDLDEEHPEQLLDYLVKIGKYIGGKPLLIPTSDETSVFVAEHSDELSELFLFSRNDPKMLQNLMSKKGMFHIATELDIPTPHTEFPTSLDDVMRYVEEARFPIVLKAIFGNRLLQRTGKKMVIVHSADELIKTFKWLDDPTIPNLMLQECIPGGDDEVYIFNGYFDADSECLNPYTGHKIRQYPVHVGCASLGICNWNQDVSDLTIGFMKKMKYSGILDIGYRLDPRDGKYKVLDINPRIGQAFRMFVSTNNSDVVRDMYLDLTGQSREKNERNDGRKWVIEDFDLISSIDYYAEGTLSIREWYRSFDRVEEKAWWYLWDLLPFVNMVFGLLKRLIWRLLKLLGMTRPAYRKQKGPEVE